MIRNAKMHSHDDDNGFTPDAFDDEFEKMVITKRLRDFDQKLVVSELLDAIQKKNSWGKNELIKLFAEVCARRIDKVKE